ncbi:Zinc knuckle protein, partial [Trichuris trichiura]
MDVDVWLGRLHDYLTANTIPKARWVPIMKSLVDDKIYKSLNSLGQECTYETLKSHLRRRFRKDDSLFVQRLQFFQRVQKPGESFDDFADELRCLGAEVGKQDDDLKEQFIMGLQDTAAQRHLLDKRPDSFDQAVQIAKQYRAAQASVENMQRRRRLMVTGGCHD